MAMLGIILQVLAVVFKLFFKIFKVTGGWIFIPLVLLFTGGFSWPLPKTIYNPFTSTPMVSIIFYLSGLWMIYTSSQNFIRWVIDDPDFKLYRLLFSTKRTAKSNLKGDANALKTKKHVLSGVFFGKLGSKYITMNENEDGHILAIGGAGSGKSSCIAIPSLITWKERVFAIDIKGELAEKSGRNAKIFNPCDSDNEYGYDPFYLLYESPNRVQDAKEIALCLIPMPANVKDPFWISSAQNLLTGCILYFSSLGQGFIETIESIQTTPVSILLEEISESGNIEAKMFINQLIGLKQETLSGIFTELSNNIMIFATDPQLKKALNNRNAINPTFLERGEDVFLQIPEHKLEQWKGLLSLIIQQFLKHFERRPDGSATPVLFLLDEFARLGKIEVISNGLATLRSKKVHICILTQSLAQLDVIYGKEQRRVIADNCSYKAILKATDADTQEYFSKLVGTYEKEKVTQSANFEQYTKLGKGTGKSKTTEEKRIIKPEEFAYLQDIVLLSPFGYARIEKAPYYKDKFFVKNLSA